MKGKKINWINSRFSTDGYIGQVHLFTIYWESRNGEGNYVIDSQLIGFAPRVSDDHNHCKVIAQEMLDDYIAFLGEG